MFEDRRHLDFAPASMALNSLTAWLHVHAADLRDKHDSELPDAYQPAQPRPLASPATAEVRR